MEPTGFTIFCDDIREEVNGKVSLIGCYGSELIVQGATFPLILPKLGFHVTVRLPTGTPNLPFKFMVYLPGDAEDHPSINSETTIPDELFAEHRVKPRDPKWEKMMGDGPRVTSLRQHFVLSPLVINEEGFIRVRVIHGDARIRAGALKIIYQAAPQITAPSTAP
jgi:hypothetical protein